MVFETVEGAEEYPACGFFDDMDLPENLLRGIYCHEFERPNSVEQRVIRPVAHGRDIVCCAKSGTGKTASWMIGTLARVDFNVLACQVLAIAPSRERALHMHEEVRELGEFLQVRCNVCVGATSWRPIEDDLRAGQHLVVGTPGRVFDAINRRILDVEQLKILVLDEADEILARGWNAEIGEIFGVLNPEVQVCLFCATLPQELPQELLDLAERFMRDPLRILGKSDELSIEGIRQYCIVVENEDAKLQLLTNLFQRLPITQAVVYCNTRATADAIAHALQAINFTASVVHAGLRSEERQLALREFRAGSSQVLIATQPLGVDSHLSVSLTINHDLPVEVEDYSRRIGRSGRFGRRGVAINLVPNQAVQAVRDIEQHYSTNIEELSADLSDIGDTADISRPHRVAQWRRLGGGHAEAVARQPAVLLQPRAATWSDAASAGQQAEAAGT